MILAVTLHFTLAVISALLLTLIYGHLTPLIAGFSLLLSFVIPTFLWIHKKLQDGFVNKSPLNHLEKSIYIFVVVVCFQHFLHLYYDAGTQMKTWNIYNYGDLPLHIAYIRNFAAKVAFWPTNPFFASQTLHYPFGLDFYNSLWESLGVSTPAHLFLVGMVLSISVLYLFHQMGGWLLVSTLFLNAGVLWYQILQQPKYNFDNLLSFKNIFLSMMTTQRGFLFAVLVAMMLFYQLFQKLYHNQSWTKLTHVIWVFLFASLPVFHAHTFVTLFMIFFCILLWHRQFSFLLKTMSLVLLFSLPLLLKISSSGKAASVIHLSWMWEQGEMGTLSYLFLNFCLWAPALFFVIWYVYKGELRKYLSLVVVCILVLAVFFNVMLAPWSWDNFKILVWPYLFINFLAAQIFYKKIPYRIQVLTFIILFSPGVMLLYQSMYEHKSGHTLFEKSQMFDAKKAILSTPANSVFATAATHLHPASYWGRNILVGYTGHLWSHNISFESTLSDLKLLYEGSDNWRELVQKYKIDYIFLGPLERQTYKTDGAKFKSELKNISQVEGVEIYETHP